MANPEQVRAAREFFRKSIPRYSAAIAHNPGLLVATHRGVTSGKISVKQLKELGGRFVKLSPEKQAAHNASLKRFSVSHEAVETVIPTLERLLAEVGKKAGAAPKPPLTTTQRKWRLEDWLDALRTNAFADLQRHLSPELFRELKKRHTVPELSRVGYELPDEFVDESIKRAAKPALERISKRALELKPEQRLEYLEQSLRHLRLAGFGGWSKGGVRRCLQRIARVAASANTRLGGKNHATPEEVGETLYKLFGRKFRIEKLPGYPRISAWTKKGVMTNLGPQWALPLVERVDLAHFDINMANYITDGKSPEHRGIAVIIPKTPQAEKFMTKITKPRLLKRPGLRLRGLVERL